MKRYKKANEGVHAPDELKEKAAQPSQKRRAPWMGAVAAVLAVVMMVGAAMGPGLFQNPSGIAGGPAPYTEGNPDPMGIGGPEGRNGGAPAYGSHALALAAYPEMNPYPRDEDFFTDVGEEEGAWEKAHDAYHEAWSAWRDSIDALTPDTDLDGLADDFLTRSAAQFLEGAGEENRIYSPLNVYMALSMLAETTGDNSRRQILDLLEVDSVEALRDRAAALWRANYRDDGVVTSLLANSLWLRDGMTYDQKTLDTLAKNYYASSFSGAMGSPEYDQALRDWLNEQTRGLLAEQAEGLEFDPATVLALASTLYFKAAWDGEFQKDRTEKDVFHTPDRDVKTDFMRQTMETRYYWGDHFTAVERNFQRGGSMWLILPDEGYTVDQLLDSGEAMDFLLADKYDTYGEDGLVSSGWADKKYLNVNLSMPKFDVSSDLDLIDGLKALGVTDVFDMGASNFEPLGAGTDESLYVSKAQHAARVKVDEEGCEAAAYTVIMVDCGGAMPPDEEVDFTLDRPFLFAISAAWTDLPLFVGTVNQPNG